jgi:hypothetical protein
MQTATNGGMGILIRADFMIRARGDIYGNLGQWKRLN